MNLTSPKTIKDICKKFDFTFSKGLGQNFLLDSSVLDAMSDVAKSGYVLEIGPGFGCLTYTLAEDKEKVVSVEIDKRLIPVLDYTLSEFDNVKVIEKDILKTDVKELIKEEFGEEKVSVVANLPYYITTPIIAALLENELPIADITVMVQKEVAERISARPGSKDYGAISVMCQFYANPEIITVVPAVSFMPPPKVDSAVLRLDILDEPSVKCKNKDKFFKVVKAAFAQRRKTLLNCLSNGFGVDKEEMARILNEVGISPQIRGEKLTLEDFAKIADNL